MIDSYDSLKTAIASHVHRGDLTASIPEFIAAAETRIYDEMRVRAMESAFSGTTASPIPSGYLEWKWLYLDTDPRLKLERRDVEWIVSRNETGKPAFFARNADSLIFWPSPDSTYNLVGCYYKRLDALSDSNTSNWLTTEAQPLILNAALAEVAQFTQDIERFSAYEGRFQQAKNRIERAYKAEGLSGSRLTTRAA